MRIKMVLLTIATFVLVVSGVIPVFAENQGDYSLNAYYWDDEYDDDYDNYYDANDEFEGYTCIHDGYSVSNKKQFKYSFKSKNEQDDCEFDEFYVTVKDNAEYTLKVKCDNCDLTVDVESPEGSRIIHGFSDFIYPFSKKIKLETGTYVIRITKDMPDSDYVVTLKSTVIIKTEKLTIASCDTEMLSSDCGKGKWTTSNEEIVAVRSTNKGKYCYASARHVGKATVTFEGNNGSKITYKITVKTSDSYPLSNAYFKMNSVGGCEPYVKISNNSDKVIKYVNLTVSFYNAVGDRVKNDIGRNYQENLLITGPLNAWASDTYAWDPVFYNYSADTMSIDKMTITYMDGSKSTVNANKRFKREYR